MIINNFHGIKDIDSRRMHIFYDDYFKIAGSNEVQLKSLDIKGSSGYQIKKAFNGMLFENLIGINNKIIILKDFNKIKMKFYSPENKIANLFFLDYALYQYPNNGNTNTSVDYELHLLPANFSLEYPIFNEEDANLADANYIKQKVFHIEGPYLYYIFKRNFLSFWNKDSFVNSLDNLIFRKIHHFLTHNQQFTQSFISSTVITSSVKNIISNQMIGVKYKFAEILSARYNKLDDKSVKNLILLLKSLLFVQEIPQKGNGTMDVVYQQEVNNSFISFILKHVDLEDNLMLNNELNLEKDIYIFRKMFADNIEVLDFFQFWKKILNDNRNSFSSVADIFNINYMFDFAQKDQIKESIYFKILEEKRGIIINTDDKKSTFLNKLLDSCKDFYNDYLTTIYDSKELRNKFNQAFNNYIIRKVQ